MHLQVDVCRYDKEEQTYEFLQPSISGWKVSVCVGPILYIFVVFSMCEALNM
jgi:hypothetical protein